MAHMLQKNPHGLIDQSAFGRKDDYLYRVSIKGLIMNDQGEVLVVKEAGRMWWDLPGGGMDHEEDIKTGIARELKEEVNLEGEFTYRVIDVDDPIYLENANVYQVRLIFQVVPENMQFSAGVDADEISYMNVNALRDSDNAVERKVYEYARLVTG